MSNKKERVLMKKVLLYTLVVFISITFISTSANCLIIDDFDNDSIIEAGELITFVGDESITESDGEIHQFNQWAWDFDGDFVIDAEGMIVTHIFDNPGYYRGYLYEVGDIGYGFTFEIEVFIANENEYPKPFGWYKNNNPGNGNHYGIEKQKDK